MQILHRNFLKVNKRSAPKHPAVMFTVFQRSQSHSSPEMSQIIVSDPLYDFSHRHQSFPQEKRSKQEMKFGEEFDDRDLRLSGIERNVSFGSQSMAGAETRSILMSILNTARKRLYDCSVETWFKDCLDKISRNPSIDCFSLLPKHVFLDFSPFTQGLRC